MDSLYNIEQELLDVIATLEDNGGEFTPELEERLIFQDKQYEITVSSGYVKVMPNEKNIKELLAKADDKMYQNKRSKSKEDVENV